VPGREREGERERCDGTDTEDKLKALFVTGSMVLAIIGIEGLGDDVM